MVPFKTALAKDHFFTVGLAVTAAVCGIFVRRASDKREASPSQFFCWFTTGSGLLEVVFVNFSLKLLLSGKVNAQLLSFLQTTVHFFWEQLIGDDLVTEVKIKIVSRTYPMIPSLGLIIALLSHSNVITFSAIDMHLPAAALFRTLFVCILSFAELARVDSLLIVWRFFEWDSGVVRYCLDIVVHKTAVDVD